jgi:mannose-6-phosphate isomerase-like protein (cupin superfamily)
MTVHYDLGNVGEYIAGLKSGHEKANPRTFHRSNKLSFGVQLFKAGEDYTKKGEPPKHEFDEIYYVLEGDGKIKVGAEQYDVKPGQAYLIPKKVPHMFFNNKKDIVFCYIFGGQDEVYYFEKRGRYKMDDKSKTA